MNSVRSAAKEASMKPITGIADCCARAASGHAAAPPSAANNSRRPMVTAIRPSRARCVDGTIARHERAVPNSAAPGAGGAGSAALNVLGTPRDEWALATPTASRGCATAFWLALSIYTRLARCHHKSRCASTHARDCLQAAEKTEDPLAREMLLR